MTRARELERSARSASPQAFSGGHSDQRRIQPMDYPKMRWNPFKKGIRHG